MSLLNWAEISEHFNRAPILLGNGFSLNFSDRLNYHSLHNNFIANCSGGARALFQEFDTNNFEAILQHIEVSRRVQETLGIDARPLIILQEEIRAGLIEAINIIHPKHHEINFPLVKHVSEQLKKFGDIFTTNYDLFSYYIILDMRNVGDNFFMDAGSNWLEFVWPDNVNRRHIYYLHGSLFVFSNGIATAKIRGNNHLLDMITWEIQSSRYPLFISEGSSESKLRQINSNRYLIRCFEMFNNRMETLVIFGHSLSPQDFHIVNAIDNNYQRVAISIKPELYPTDGHIEAEKNRIASLFNRAQPTFFDANTLFSFVAPQIA